MGEIVSANNNRLVLMQDPKRSERVKAKESSILDTDMDMGKPL